MSNPKWDPVHQDPDGQWYFYDETGADRYGPFKNEEQTRAELQKYVEWLEKGPPSDKLHSD